MRKRLLSLFYGSWYPQWGLGGASESSETTFFGHGLFESLGFEEIHLDLETVAVHPAESMAVVKSQGPYEAVFIVPQHEILFWLKDAAEGAPVIAWMTDDSWRHDSFCKKWMGAADLIATTDAGAFADYRNQNFPAVLTNWGCRPEWEAWGAGIAKADRAYFHGLIHGHRKESLEALRLAGDVPIEVHGWEGDAVRGPIDYHRALASSAFCLNLTQSSDGKTPQMKGRLFEPQLHETILVTEACPRLEEYWNPDEECLVFSSAPEAHEKMKALLSDRPALARMAEKAKARALAEHTYKHRLTEILKAVAAAPLAVRRLAAAAPSEKFTVIVPLCSELDPEVALITTRALGRTEARDVEVLFAPYPEDVPYLSQAGRFPDAKVLPAASSLAEAMNRAIEAASGERLLIVAGDVLATPGAVRSAFRAPLERGFWIPALVNIETGEAACGPDCLNPIPAFMALLKADALSVGGYDEAYAAGIGYEGRDFAARLAGARGTFFADWDRQALIFPRSGAPEEAKTEPNRARTALKWRGMPFGDNPSAFDVWPEHDPSGRRAFRVATKPGQMLRAVEMTEGLLARPR